MTEDRKKPRFRMLFLIAAPKLTEKAMELMQQGRVPIQYRFHAMGTASNEVIDMLGLGLGSIEKNILMCMLPKPFADQLLKKLKKELHLGMPNTGVAFTIALTGSNARLVRLIEYAHAEQEIQMREGEEQPVSEQKYSMIMAIVNQGYSEDVMAAAKPVGASGGTVFHCRRVGSEETLKFWGISVQPEREVVLILTEKEKKLQIMEAIGEACGMKSDAHGVVLSLPVDHVVGLD